MAGEDAIIMLFGTLSLPQDKVVSSLADAMRFADCFVSRQAQRATAVVRSPPVVTEQLAHF